MKHWAIWQIRNNMKNKPHLLVNIFGFMLIVALLALNSCEKWSLCKHNGLQIYERGSREYELAQHDTSCSHK